MRSRPSWIRRWNSGCGFELQHDDADEDFDDDDDDEAPMIEDAERVERSADVVSLDQFRK